MVKALLDRDSDNETEYVLNNRMNQGRRKMKRTCTDRMAKEIKARNG
jgi:hypothetical protein